MKGLVNQFHVQVTPNLNLTDNFKFVFRPKGQRPAEYDKLNMWIIGPKHDDPNLFLFGFMRCCNITSLIECIVPGNVPRLIYVRTEGCKWYECDFNESASSYAATLDGIVRGAYSDVLPVHSRSIQYLVDEFIE